MRHRGVTLIEATMAMAVVVVLTTILLVALRRIRPVTDEFREVNNIRMCMVDFLGWAAEHEEKWPTFGLPAQAGPTGPYRLLSSTSPNFTAQAAGVYFGAVISWPHIIHAWKGRDEPHWYGLEGVDLSLIGGMQNSPGLLPPFPSRYVFSNTMRTRHDLWVWPGRGRPITYAEQLSIWGREVRVSDVRAPAAKGVLVYDPLSYASINAAMKGVGPGIFVGFADGSAALKAYADAKPTADDPSNLYTRAPGRPVEATLDGYLGVDF